MSTTTVSTRRAATQARLADAAVAVFARKGVPGSTVEEICEEAGFTRGAFYSNFDSKDELCMAVLSRYAEKNLAVLSSSLDFPNDGQDALRDRIHDIIALFSSAVGSDPTTVVAILEITLEATRNPRLREANTSRQPFPPPCARWWNKPCATTTSRRRSASTTSSRSPVRSSTPGCWRPWRQGERPTSTG